MEYPTFLSCGGRWAPFMFVHNDTIYAGAGEDEQLSVRNDLWRFDFSTANVNELQAPLIHAFPNPATDQISISGISDVEVNVYDCMGRVVLSATMNENTINIASLENGTYHLQIANVASRVRFVKQ